MGKSTKKNNKFKYTVKDVVLISLMSLAALAFSGVMPLTLPLVSTLFGITHLVTCVQANFFFTIAIYKVKKPFALLIMSSIMGLIMISMHPIMAIIFVGPALILEFLNYTFFSGYKEKLATIATVGALFPASLLFFYLALLIINDNKASLINNWPAIVIICGVIVLSYLASFLGVKIVDEITRVKKRRTKL